MSSLSEDMIENILTRLPVKSISRFRCLSKQWRLLFRNPNFIKNHLNHAITMNKFNILASGFGVTDDKLYSVDNDVLSSNLGHALMIDYPFKSQVDWPLIVGSCDGLVVCVGRVLLKMICIWNPATREYKRVPESPDSESGFSVWGFGFDCKMDDYKLLRIGGSVESGDSEASIYSLASNSWKKLGSIPYNFTDSEDGGLLINGVLYWMAVHRVGLNYTGVAVCFDVSAETFHHVLLPNNYSIGGISKNISDLGIWEGKLCLLHMNHMEAPDVCTHQNDHIDVWTMTDYKWSKLLKIAAQISNMYYGRPIRTLQNGETLIQGRPRFEGCGGLLSYDHKLERVRALKIHGFPKCSEAETYIETLVALNSGTYVGQ